jgi:hypothetical protein
MPTPAVGDQRTKDDTPEIIGIFGFVLPNQSLL